MELDPLLLRLLNSVDAHFVKCGKAVIHPGYRYLLSNSILEPFTLITQITEAPLLFVLEQATFRIEPGQALIVPANVRYRLKLIDDQQAVTNWLNLNYTVMQHFSVFDFIDTPFVTSREVGEAIGMLQAKFVHMQDRELDHGTALSRAIELKQALMTILSMLAENSRYKEGSLEKLHHVKRFANVFAYIDAHLAEKIKIPQLAQIIYLSTSQFHKQFQEAFDITPLQYIRQQRFKKAQYLLATTDLTMSEIAERVGYDSPIPFFRFFKSMNGESPGHYRKAFEERSSSA